MCTENNHIIHNGRKKQKKRKRKRVLHIFEHTVKIRKIKHVLKIMKTHQKILVQKRTQQTNQEDSDITTDLSLIKFYKIFSSLLLLSLLSLPCWIAQSYHIISIYTSHYLTLLRKPPVLSHDASLSLLPLFISYKIL